MSVTLASLNEETPFGPLEMCAKRRTNPFFSLRGPLFFSAMIAGQHRKTILWLGDNGQSSKVK